jgi:hypothetical protein
MYAKGKVRILAFRSVSAFGFVVVGAIGKPAEWQRQ